MGALTITALCVVCCGLPMITAFSFSAAFSNGVVLQRAAPKTPDVRAAVYGSGAVPGQSVHVRVSGSQSTSDALEVESFSSVAADDGSWKVPLCLYS
eukprot:SAG31_NODE_661_length_13035_cov_12.057591_7_plen_97_part_00